MIPPPFEYRAPDSLSEALALLREHGDEARLMAGGQSLLPMLKLRLIRPAVVIDIGGLQELKEVGKAAAAARPKAPDVELPGQAALRAVAAPPGAPVTEGADALRVGGLVTERTLERALAERQPLLAEAAASIGDIHIRNLGTLGGALSQADPSGDLAPAVLALEATLTAQSAAGSRTHRRPRVLFRSVRHRAGRGRDGHLRGRAGAVRRPRPRLRQAHPPPPATTRWWGPRCW